MPALYRSKPLNLVPQPFQAPTHFNVDGEKPGPSSEKPGAVRGEAKKDKKEKKEKDKKPPKAKTVEQEAKAVSW